MNDDLLGDGAWLDQRELLSLRIELIEIDVILRYQSHIHYLQGIYLIKISECIVTIESEVFELFEVFKVVREAVFDG